MSEIQRYRQAAGEHNDTMVPDPSGPWILIEDVHIEILEVIADIIDSKDQDHAKAIEELKAENYELIWNLGGCSTYATGCCLDDGHDEKIARPALNDVLQMAKDNRKLKSEVETMKLVQKNNIRNNISDAKTVEKLLSENERLREALHWGLDEEPCRFDHNGNCQEHGCFEGSYSCYNKEIKELLGSETTAKS